ncbi:MAG TPA: hypothetical protein DIS79_03900 [Bacteroidetes bacterium]|nr:hypothetical protein [Bacteroidota bacterium]HRK05611.1 cytochrome c peroxidase [Chlorobiota bacterium]
MRTLSLVISGITLACFVAALSPSTPSFERHSRLTSFLTEKSLSLLEACDSLSAQCTSITSDTDVAVIRATYEELRLRYKTLEPFIDYIDPEYVSWYVNGAPLPRLDKKSQFVDIVEPQGLQVIDELLYDDDSVVISTTNDIRIHCDKLGIALREITASVRRSRWTDRMVLEAMRTSVIRIVSLGLTNFDRPASTPLVRDEVTVLSTISYVVDGYRSSLGERALQVDVCQQYINTARQLLNSATSYDDVDRVEMIRSSLDPLYGAILDIHTALGVEFASEVSTLPSILNERSRSIFSTDVMNPLWSSGEHASSNRPERVELGRTLFFDPILSSTMERSCASCHQPDRAFTDGQTTSLALGRTGNILRNAPTLVNAVFARRFFYDLRAQRLDDVLQHVVTHRQEFGSSLVDVIQRINESDEYQEMFARAFPDEHQRGAKVSTLGRAIASYVATLVSFDSPVDRYLRGETQNLPADVRRGMNLFMGRAACGTCHFAPTFAGFVPPRFLESESEILGVATRPDTANAVIDPDVGRAGGILRENSPIYRNAFKTPTVRNIALTAPYMHNGAYPKLEDVVKFYDLGGGAGIGIQHPYQTLAPDRIDLTQRDYADMIAFLQALTDTSGLTKRPQRLPRYTNSERNRRTIGGDY